MTDRILCDFQDGVADVRFNRPERHNALDSAQLQALYDMGADLAQRSDLRAIVLSGVGPSFCSGLDFPSFQQAGQDIRQAFKMGAGAPANFAQRVATVWRSAPVPVIAALHGSVFGGGLQIALGADLRIAAPDAKLCIMEIEYGLIPDMGISQTLPPILPYDQALELSLSGRRLDALQAHKLGLVTRVEDQPYAAAMQLAHEMASRSPDAVRATKALYLQSWPQDQALLREEARLQQAIMAQPNFAEAVAAKMQKRSPQFQDRSY